MDKVQAVAAEGARPGQGHHAGGAGPEVQIHPSQDPVEEFAQAAIQAHQGEFSCWTGGFVSTLGGFRVFR